MTKATAEVHMARWWADWWAADYSWEGLARSSATRPESPDKPWRRWWVTLDNRLTSDAREAARRATLQDYWRRGPGSGREGDPRADTAIEDEMRAQGELTEGPGGVLWHLVHVPANWPDGTPAKSTWDDARKAHLDRLLTPRLDVAAAGIYEGADHQAQFRGAILLAAPHPRNFDTTPIAADFGRVCFLGGPNFSVDPRREVPAFSRFAKFDNAAFSGDARFDNVAFSGYGRFDNAVFCGDARFDNSAFSGVAWFDNAAFYGDARFEVAAFSGGAWFDNTAFSGVAGFDAAAFSGGARFENAAFSGVAGFDNAAFSGDARFENATFSADARFENATFSADARFDNAIFSGNAWFGAAAFAGRLNFHHATCLADVSFVGRFMDLVKGPGRQDIHVEPLAAADGGLIGSLSSQGGPTEKARRSVVSVQAENALFAADFTFDNRDILAASSFKGARFLGLASFHGSAMHQGVSFQGAEFERALAHSASYPQPRCTRLDAAVRRDLALQAEGRDVELWPAWRSKSWEFERRETYAKPDRRFEDLERAFRTLKQAMETTRHRTEEARFFKLELQARRRRRDIPGWERFASDAYGVVSDYGSDILRPQAWLTAVALVVALIVWAPARHACDAYIRAPLPAKADDSPIAVAARVCPRLGVPLWDDLSLAVDALAFSGGNILPLPGGFAAANDPRDHAVATILKANAPPFWRLALRALATLQSLISVSLIFLTGLALRRRFQIN